MLAEQEPAARIGEKVTSGHKIRADAKDKAEVREYAAAHWKKYPDDTIADVLRIPAIEPATHYYDRLTVQRWIKDLKPGGARRGRPKKK